MNTPLRIAIAGLGTVGGSLVSILENERALLAARAGRAMNIAAVSARNPRSGMAYRFEADPVALAHTEADVVVELIGGAEGPARALVEAALRNGKHVITANKALIATHGAELAALAQEKNVSLMFEAAVAGGIPILKTLREGLAGNHIRRVTGILNGTCNYILTHMWEDKREFEDVLTEAQTLGYAEADPSFDVDGVDAAHKLAILAALAFGHAPDLAALSIRGIREVTLADMQFADELGYRIRLLGVAAEGEAPCVYPALVAKNSSLAHTRGVVGAVQVEGDAVGTLFLQGRGAGGNPTASAVIADIIDIARGNATPPFGIKNLPRASKVMADAAKTCEYYIRLSVPDKPGILATITSALRDGDISVKSLLQHGQQQGEGVQIVIVTHECAEADISRVLDALHSRDILLKKPFSMRIEL